ncbi:MAG: GtrA family protein [Ruminococcaceae bacterium]|nr:GtrA family protein [Oscillospiraceae bacterium]
MYLVFGALTTIVSYVTYAVATRIFQIGIIPADIISWVCSVAFAFVTNKLYVFKSTSNSIKNVTKEAVSFVTARLLSLGMEVGMIYVMILPVIGINDLVAKLIANIAVIIANYFLSKLIIFKKK